MLQPQRTAVLMDGALAFHALFGDSAKTRVMRKNFLLQRATALTCVLGVVSDFVPG